MRLPDFLIIGAAKSGTSYLNEILKLHPEIFMPVIKEVHFFNNESEYFQGDQRYAKWFEYAKQDQIVGESTPVYFSNPKIPERIRSSLGPNLKLIVLLRDPVERAISHYKMSFQKGYHKTYDFLNDFHNSVDLVGGYANVGFYARSLSRYLDFFELENFLLIDFEDLSTRTSVVLNEVQDFLGLSHTDLHNEDYYRNKTHYPKIRKLNKVLNSKNIFINSVRKILSPGVKEKIRKSVLELNSSTSKKFQTIAIERKKELYNKYYKEDYNQLRELTGRNFNWNEKYD